MRRVLGSVLLVSTLALGLAGCGGDGAGEDGAAIDPGTSTSSPAADLTDEPADGAPLDHELVELVTETAAGGQVGSALALTDDAAAAEFATQFERDTMGTRLTELAGSTEVPPGMVAYAAVVAIGCDAPTDVTVTEGVDGPVVEAVQVPDPKQECLAAMTTVAFLLVPASAV